VFHQFDGLQAGGTGLGGAGIIPAQQEHQGSGQLLRSPSGPLSLEGVPIAIADGQLTLEGHGLIQGSLRPAPGWLGRRGGHWTFVHGRPHPDATDALL
jgi:hypothetical protein